jgi:predicted dehydrogenase
MPGFAGAKESVATALARRNVQRGQADAARFGLKAFATTRELCQCPEVDAVFATGANATHLEDVLAAIEHGKAVLCEKPLAMNAGEAEQMLAAARQRGVLLGVAQCFRFCHSVNRIRECVQRQEIGRAIGIRIDFSFQGPASPRDWLYDLAVAGGGPIADVGVHCIDAMRFILADEPVSCSAMTARDECSGSVEASAACVLRFSQGALGSSFVSFRSPYRTMIEVAGSEGSIFARDGLTVDHPVTVEFHTPAGTRTEEFSNADAYALQVDAFSAAMKNGGSFAASAEDGLQNQRILDALYLSAREGREVELPTMNRAEPASGS